MLFLRLDCRRNLLFIIAQLYTASGNLLSIAGALCETIIMKMRQDNNVIERDDLLNSVMFFLIFLINIYMNII